MASMSAMPTCPCAPGDQEMSLTNTLPDITLTQAIAQLQLKIVICRFPLTSHQVFADNGLTLPYHHGWRWFLIHVILFFLGCRGNVHFAILRVVAH